MEGEGKACGSERGTKKGRTKYKLRVQRNESPRRVIPESSLDLGKWSAHQLLVLSQYP